MKPRKSWREKLADSKDLPKVERIPIRLAARWGTGTFVIPAPIEVDAIMKRVPKGKLATINEIRALLARRHGASTACPITTGIFAWISAHAAAQDEREGRKRVTPYWRTLKQHGEINPKYPGGIAAQRARLRAEGHRVVTRGRKFYVEDFAASLVRILPPMNVQKIQESGR